MNDRFADDTVDVPLDEPARDERDRAPAAKAASVSTRALSIGAPDDRFKLTWLHEVVIDFDQQWLVKKLFPRVGVISLYGDSQSFKTFVAIHLCYCIALGKEFAGRKVKVSLPCVYIAAEDSEGVKKRLVAYHMSNKDHLPTRDQIPIAVMEATPNLGSLKGTSISSSRQCARPSRRWVKPMWR